MLAIPEYAFAHRNELEEVELHNNFRGIGQYAFLYYTALKEVLTSDRVVEKIGQLVFYGCSLTKFRNPPLVTTAPHGMLYCCRCMFSLELSENVFHVERLAFGYSYSLRILPSHSTPSLHIMFSFSAMTYYTFSARRRQL